MGLARRLSGVSGKDLGTLADQMRGQLSGPGAVLAMSDDGGKATVAATVSQDLVDRLSAVEIVQAAVQALGGKGGGGRPDRAQGGAPSLDAADDAIAAVEALIAAKS